MPPTRAQQAIFRRIAADRRLLQEEEIQFRKDALALSELTDRLKYLASVHDETIKAMEIMEEIEKERGK